MTVSSGVFGSVSACRYVLALIITIPALAWGQAPALVAPSPLPEDSASYGTSGLQLGVLLQVRADLHEVGNPKSTFLLRKAEIGIKGRIADDTQFSFELDAATPTEPLRRTYVRLTHLPNLDVKIGLEKAPLGLEELLSTATIPFVDRSEVSGRFAAAEELGVHLESRWQRWLFQGSITNGAGRLMRDDNQAKDLSARAVWAPLPWASVGAAVLDGRVGQEERSRDRYNFELKLGSVDSGVQSEAYRAEDADVQSWATYVAAFHAFPVEGTRLTHIQPAIRYEWLERSDDATAEELRLLTLGVSALLAGHRSKFLANYLLDMRSGSDQDEIRLQYQVEF